MGLSTLQDKSIFGRIAADLLPSTFPTLFLEGYKQARSEIERRHAIRPSVVMSATGWYYNEPFKFFAAHQATRKARLVAVQHGAFYGTSRVNWAERHESTIADSYLVWGWADRAPLRNMPSLKLSRLRRSSRMRRGTNILFVCNRAIRPQYTVTLNSIPIAGQWDAYVNWQLRFFAALPSHLVERISYRRYPETLPGITEEPVWRRIRQRFGDLNWDDDRKSFDDCLRGSFVVIVDHPGTTMLESLVANIPTILFWNECLWKLRPSAIPWFDRLRDAGVLLATPESAAQRLEDASTDMERWWNSSSVQDARRRFISQHAFATDNCDAIWASEIREGRI